MRNTLLFASRNICLMVLLMAATSVTSNAATYYVLNTGDAGANTLRAALTAAADGDVIEIRTTGTVTLLSALPIIIKNITIIGPGPDDFTISGNNTYRVLTLAEASIVSISGLTVSNGAAVNCAGIYSGGSSLTMDFVVVKNSTAQNIGGGICDSSLYGTTITRSKVLNNLADFGGGLAEVPRSGIPPANPETEGMQAVPIPKGLVVSDSTVSGNIGIGQGGGVFIQAGVGKPSTFERVTFKANQSPGFAFGESGSVFAGFVGEGAGLYIDTPGVPGIPTHSVINCTFSQNASNGTAGGILNRGSLNLYNSTISQNSALSVGGVANFPSVPGTGMTMESNIIAGNTASQDPDLAVAGTYTGSKFNLIGNGSGVTTITNGVDANQVGTTASPINPKLNTLGFYGGYTETYTLQATSPAYDKGKNSGLSSLDQRGAVRTNDLPGTPNASGGDGTDIGSTELLTPTAAVSSLSGRATNGLGAAVPKARISVLDLETGTRIVVVTNQLGKYVVDGLAAGKTYIVSVTAKGYPESVPLALYLGDSIKDFDLVLPAAVPIRTRTISNDSPSRPIQNEAATPPGSINRGMLVTVKRQSSKDENEPDEDKKPD